MMYYNAIGLLFLVLLILFNLNKNLYAIRILYLRLKITAKGLKGW